MHADRPQRRGRGILKIKEGPTMSTSASSTSSALTFDITPRVDPVTEADRETEVVLELRPVAGR